MKKVYVSPSNQTRNVYAWGDTNEAAQCEKIAASCRAALEAAGIAVQVATREMDMAARCKASDAFGADIHLPIHTNAFNGSVMGTRLFCSRLDGAGAKAAQAVLDALAPITPGTSENIKADPTLYEVRKPKAPTVYVEAEFHDAPEGARWITEHTDDIGRAIADGLCAYFGIDRPLYRVQVGAFREKKNAEALRDALKAAGYSAFITG